MARATELLTTVITEKECDLQLAAAVNARDTNKLQAALKSAAALHLSTDNVTKANTMLSALTEGADAGKVSLSMHTLLLPLDAH